MVDDEVIEEVEDDIDEESILSDPSDLFDDQTESEPESEPEVVYRQRKLPHNTFIDNEAEEDNDFEEEELDEFYDQSAVEALEDDESDYEGPCNREIDAPLNAQDFADEEAIEHNDLNEMYSDLVGKEELPSEAEQTARTILIDDDSDSSVQINDPSYTNSDSSSPISSPIKTKKASKRRRARILESDDEAPNSSSPSVSKSPDVKINLPVQIIAHRQFIDSPTNDSPVVVKKKRRKVLESDGEMSTGRKPLKPLSEPQVIVLDSSIPKKGPSDPASSPGFRVASVDSPVVVKRKRAVRKLILESDDEGEEVVKSEQEPAIFVADDFDPFEDSLRAPKVDMW